LNAKNLVRFLSAPGVNSSLFWLFEHERERLKESSPAVMISAKYKKKLEARVGIEPTHKGFADLSLTTWVPRLEDGDAKNPRAWRGRQILERETGFEPATSTLARSHSTTELLPLAVCDYSESLNYRANESGDTSP
jgi:hypothetical protein